MEGALRLGETSFRQSDRQCWVLVNSEESEASVWQRYISHAAKISRVKHPAAVTADLSTSGRLHAYERIMQLLTGSTVEKKGEILTGSPESQVDGIVAFLTANGFLESDSERQ